MSMSGAELIFDGKHGTGESPVWLAEEQALYWVDIPGKRIWRWAASSGATNSWLLPEMVGCIAHIGGNRWLAAMETGVFSVTLNADNSVNTAMLARANHASANMRFNDGRCDRQGRFLAGTMFLDMAAARQVGAVSSFDGQGGQRLLLDKMIVPNGMAFSPDGRTMYLSDSHPTVQTVWAFDYDTATGTPSNKRVFVDMNPLPGRPDGAAVDADGCYWICGNDAGLVHRFTPLGKLDRSLALPVKKPAMCAFGGENLDTLFVTSIRPGGVDLSDQPLAGGVFALRPAVRGLPEPKFRSTSD
jgi:sugar lactone lactonase YvrE